MKLKKREQLEADLAMAQRRILEAKAQLAQRLAAAFDALPAAGNRRGSAVIITITALGGKEIVPPVAITNGLSPEAIKALRTDICVSFEKATLVNAEMMDFHKAVYYRK